MPSMIISAVPVGPVRIAALVVNALCTGGFTVRTRRHPGG